MRYGFPIGLTISYAAIRAHRVLVAADQRLCGRRFDSCACRRSTQQAKSAAGVIGAPQPRFTGPFTEPFTGPARTDGV